MPGAAILGLSSSRAVRREATLEARSIEFGFDCNARRARSVVNARAGQM